MDQSDETRSRSIPSRTKIGKRAAVIDKFPSLGAPLVLFGGLVTIPFWGYRNTPLALLEVMMSDLPRVEYIPDSRDKKITQKDIDETIKRDKALQERMKTRGLGVKLKNQVDVGQFVQSKMKGPR